MNISRIQGVTRHCRLGSCVVNLVHRMGTLFEKFQLRVGINIYFFRKFCSTKRMGYPTENIVDLDPNCL